MRNAELNLPEWAKDSRWNYLFAAMMIAGLALILSAVPSGESPQPDRVESPEDAYIQHGGIDPARGWGVCRKVAMEGLTGNALIVWTKWEYTVSLERAEKIVDLSGEFLCPETLSGPSIGA